jgi:hypothetical protein
MAALLTPQKLQDPVNICFMQAAGTVHGRQSVKRSEAKAFEGFFALITISLCGILACSNLNARIRNDGFLILFLLCRGTVAAVKCHSCGYLLSC